MHCLGMVKVRCKQLWSKDTGIASLTVVMTLAIKCIGVRHFQYV